MEDLKDLEVRDEFGVLTHVVLGIADSNGPTPTIEESYDPKSKEHIKAGTFPIEKDLISEMSAFKEILEKYKVNVYRPNVIENYNQIFSRDIGFVIDGTFVVSNMIEERSREIEAIEYLISQFDDSKVIRMEDPDRLEGGDVMPVGDYIFVGYSEEPDFSNYEVSRSNAHGLKFLENNFPKRKVKGFELNKSDEIAKDNALHLDCCFQPLGLGHCVIYPGGFKNKEDVTFIFDFFGKENCIEISRDEMYHMGSNFFSIKPDVVVAEKSLDRIHNEMEQRGYTVEKVKYFETAKMEGLLRCSTLPLRRKYN